jgi:hypothetical protein
MLSMRHVAVLVGLRGDHLGQELSRCRGRRAGGCSRRLLRSSARTARPRGPGRASGMRGMAAVAAQVAGVGQGTHDRVGEGLKCSGGWQQQDPGQVGPRVELQVAFDIGRGGCPSAAAARASRARSRRRWPRVRPDECSAECDDWYISEISDERDSRSASKLGQHLVAQQRAPARRGSRPAAGAAGHVGAGHGCLALQVLAQLAICASVMPPRTAGAPCWLRASCAPRRPGAPRPRWAGRRRPRAPAPASPGGRG